MTGTTPFPFQTEDVRRAAEDYGGRAILGHEMGLGKSFSALLFTQKLPAARPVVIVCPASLKWMWEGQARHHLGIRVEVLEGTRPPAEGLQRKRDFLVVNYDILGQRRAENAGPGWLGYLKSLRPGIVILDEIQMIKSRSARMSRSVRELCQGVPHVLGLSGTPLVNRPAELWHPLHIIRPDLYPNFYKFAHAHCRPRRTPWGWDFSGASNLDELHARITHPKTGCLIRRRKDEVLNQLPPKRRSVIPLDLINRREYRRAVADFLGWLEEQSPARARKARRAETIVKLGELKRLAARGKLPSVFDWIDNFLMETNEKLIAFGVHRQILHAVMERYGNQAVLVDGSVTGRKRQLAVDTFLKRDRTRLFVGNIKAAGTGWSAPGVSTTAFLELPWASGDVLQAEDRTHGISRGKTGVSSHAVFLLARGTVELPLLELIQRKQQNLNQVLDGGAGEDLNIIDELTKQVLKDGK